MMSIQTIGPKHLSEYLKYHPKALLIDLRREDAYQQSHIKGAINIPFEKIEKRGDFFPKRQELVFYCERGGRAMAAARLLGEKGYHTTAVIGTYEEIV